MWFGLILSASLYYYFSRNVYAPDASLAHLTFKSAENQQYNLDHYENQAVVVHFYAAWCGPCMKELPYLNEASQKLNESGITLIGLTDDDFSTMRKTQDKFNIKFPLFQLEGSLRANGVPSIPTTFVLDKSGAITYSLAGVIDWNNPTILEEIISSVRKSE